MWFWVFMLIFNLLIPLMMIGFGKYFIKCGGPKNINMLSGYRTTMSMKNKETWIFAHNYCGKLWWRLGWIILGLSVIAMIFVINQDIVIISIVALIISGAQLVFMIAPIIPTEIALKKNFDKNGERKLK